MLDEILNSLQEGQGEFEFGGRKIKYNVTPGKTEFVIEREFNDNEDLKRFVEDFKNDVKLVDDKIFNNACNIFKDSSDISLHDLSKLLDDCDDSEKVHQYISEFATAINSSIDCEIDRLSDMYFE
ncbi:MAG: hypothetical protein Q4D29_13310 [Lachnospiraceae bacterium]|nr:hypothetical protein [Lachnospiraceae bacterium]